MLSKQSKKGIHPETGMMSLQMKILEKLILEKLYPYLGSTKRSISKGCPFFVLKISTYGVDEFGIEFIQVLFFE